MEPTPWTSATRSWTAEQRAAGLRESTIRLWRYYLRRFAQDHPDPWTVTDPDGRVRPLTRADIIDWLAAHSRWSPSTKKSARSALTSFYGWAKAAGHIRRNPTRKLPKVRVPRGHPRPAPDHVIREAMARASDRVRLMIMLAAFLGLRRAEISQVHTQDLDGRSLLVHGKGGVKRTVPVPRALSALIAGRPEGWLFPSGTGHLTPGHTGKLMSRAIPGRWTAHTLRHAAATAWAEAGLDLDELAELLGHRGTDTTRGYKKIHRPKLAAGVEKAAARLTSVVLLPDPPPVAATG